MITIKNSTILDVAFFGLIFAIFASLNSITYLLLGVEQVASPLILIFCTLILTKAGISKKSFNHYAVILLYTVFAVYYISAIGARLYLVDVVYRNVMFDKLMNLVTTFIIILSVHQYLYRRLVIDNKEVNVFICLYVPILFSCLYAVYQSVTGVINIMGDDHGRVMGFFANPNALGVVANIGLAMTFYSCYRHRGWILVKLAMIPLLLFVSFISLSRASMVTCGVIILFGIFWVGSKYFSSRLSTQKKFFIVAGIPIVLFTYIGFNLEAILVEYTTYWEAKKIMTMVDLVFQGNFSKENTSGRSEVFKYAFYAISNRPIFGNGIGYFSYFPEELGFEHGCHNTYLLIWGDAGILSLIVFLSFKIYVFIKSFFVENLSGMLAFMFMLIWAMQNVGNHNGLDDKMENILITVSVVFLMYGQHQLKSKMQPQLNK